MSVEAAAGALQLNVAKVLVGALHDRGKFAVASQQVLSLFSAA